MIDLDSYVEKFVPTDYLIPVGWAILDKNTKKIKRTSQGTDWQARKKSAFYITKAAAKAQCKDGELIVVLYAIDEENY